jgi:hypothetical protein
MSCFKSATTLDLLAQLPSPNQSLFSEEDIVEPANFHLDHASLLHHVSFDRTQSSPTPIQEGIASGYFNNQAMHLLLDLENSDVLLHSGTYGHKEPGVTQSNYHSHIMDPMISAFYRLLLITTHHFPVSNFMKSTSKLILMPVW